MRLLLTRLALLVALAWSTSLSGCGPPTTEERSNTTASAPVDGQRGVAPAPTPAAIISSSSPSAPAPVPERPLVVAEWMARALRHPDVQVRLTALETWGQQRPSGVEPLLLALNDVDERVRTRALQLIEQDWMRAQAAEPQAKP